MGSPPPNAAGGRRPAFSTKCHGQHRNWPLILWSPLLNSFFSLEPWRDLVVAVTGGSPWGRVLSRSTATEQRAVQGSLVAGEKTQIEVASRVWGVRLGRRLLGGQELRGCLGGGFGGDQAWVQSGGQVFCGSAVGGGWPVAGSWVLTGGAGLASAPPRFCRWAPIFFASADCHKVTGTADDSGHGYTTTPYAFSTRDPEIQARPPPRTTGRCRTARQELHPASANNPATTGRPTGTRKTISDTGRVDSRDRGPPQETKEPFNVPRPGRYVRTPGPRTSTPTPTSPSASATRDARAQRPNRAQSADATFLGPRAYFFLLSYSSQIPPLTHRCRILIPSSPPP